MIADPRHRQVRQDFLCVSQALALQGIAGGNDDVIVRQHDALGPSRGTGSVENDRQVVALAQSHLFLEERRLAGVERPPRLLDGLETEQEGLGVVAQPPRVFVDDDFELRAAFLDQQKLVHLLLVLGDGKAGFSVLQDELHFVRHGVLVKRHRNPAETLCRHHGPVKLRPIIADDRHLVAALQALGGQPAGQRPHFVEYLPPTVLQPDAEILFAHGDALRMSAGAVEEKLGKGVGRTGLLHGVRSLYKRVDAAAQTQSGRAGDKAWQSAAWRGKLQMPTATVGSVKRRESV